MLKLTKKIMRAVIILIKVSYKDFAEAPAEAQFELVGISMMVSFATIVNG